MEKTRWAPWEIETLYGGISKKVAGYADRVLKIEKQAQQVHEKNYSTPIALEGSVISELDAEIRARTQKIQDQSETIREKNGTIEILQDEVTALQLELVHLEDKVSKLWDENQQLVQRWLKKMNEEAQQMNEEVIQEESSVARITHIKGVNNINSRIKKKTLPVNDDSSSRSTKKGIRIPKNISKKIDTNNSEIHSIAVSPMGGILAVGGIEPSVLLYDVDTGTLKGKLRGSGAGINDVTFSSDGAIVAAASSDNSIYIWASNTGRLIKAFTGHISKVVVARFTLDMKILVSASNDRTVKVWDVKSGNYNEALSIVTGHMDFGIRLWNTKTGERLKELKVHKDSIVSLCLSPNGDQIAASSRDGSISVIDVLGFKVLRILTADGFVPSGIRSKVIYGPTGQHVVSGSNNGSLYFWDMEKSQAPAERLALHHSSFASVCWDTLRNRIYSAESSRVVYILS
ncbi:Protein tipD [Zancudomyces culisetae]|uniref:Protein tipD n=1 Tax=Zancudomyces culisetae TaxID=1213189 RepID=A0A1R1PLK8_ZANCU|nr:Protein tipD [Zancudomyces culisetae]|eukprot:OMH81861.1 Protein tipD [Zancudomyces culisetae]